MTSTASKAPVLPETAGRSAITLLNLTKRFGVDVLAVDDLSLEVERGMVFGLLGPNGAGKTTALRMVLGLIHPTKGEAYLFGQRVYPGSPLLLRVGALVEGPGFVPFLSGMNNLKTYWNTGGRRMEDAPISARRLNSLASAPPSTAKSGRTRSG